MNLNLSLKLDWPAYFRDFCLTHGGDPVKHENRLLFRDGWRYSLKDYKGPEWPPPEDPKRLELLQRLYWARRRAKVLHDLSRLDTWLGSIQQAQARCSVPLRVKLRYVTNEDGKRVVRREEEPLNLRPFLDRREMMVYALRECETELKRLKIGTEADGGDNQRWRDGVGDDIAHEPVGAGVPSGDDGGVPRRRGEGSQVRRPVDHLRQQYPPDHAGRAEVPGEPGPQLDDEE